MLDNIIIGYVDMVADLFHFGHNNFLESAKKQCDYLIVGLCSDEYSKGYKRKPIMNINERVKSVQMCKYVDKILTNIPVPITEEFIKEHNINIVMHAHSEDENDIYNIYYQVPIKINIFKRLDYCDGISTSDIIKRIINDILN
jgi:cytidyltransferase-like protein